jgi:hypothetical protein
MIFQIEDPLAAAPVCSFCDGGNFFRDKTQPASQNLAIIPLIFQKVMMPAVYLRQITGFTARAK